MLVCVMDELDVNWEDILVRAGISEYDSKLSYEKIDPKDEKYENYTHCSHVCIYARTNSMSLEVYDRKAIILMQVRFDGFLGFPGGIVDPGETPIQALNRELGEEAGWYEENGPVTQDHHLFSHVNKKQKLVLHFYGIEVSEEKIKQIETTTLQSSGYGDEVLGSCRVPLYTMNDKYSGFPSFLHNNFVGNAKVQLIEALVNLKFLSVEYVIQALHSKPRTIL